MKVTINTTTFAAAALFRGIYDIRFYLNGLLLETGANGARLVGSDGHQLGVARLEGEFPEASIILPNSIVAVAKLKARGAKFVTLDFNEGHQTFDESGVLIARNIVLTFGDMTAIGIEVGGKFPDYRRVVPSETDGIVAQYDPRLVNRIDKACNMLGYKFFVGIAHNGDCSGLSVIDYDFVVVTMPFRAEPDTTTPTWVQASLNPPADTAMQQLAA